MSLRHRYLNLISRLAPASAVGVTLILGAVAPSEAATPPSDQIPAVSARVSERLAAIREAVSVVAPAQAQQEGDGTQLAQWGNWGNGWRNGGWNNWRNHWNNWRNWHNY